MAATIGGDSYARVCAITVNSAAVSGSPTGFPIVIPASALPADMLAGGDNAAQSDGRDIRVCLNSDGTGQIPAFADWSSGTGAIYCGNAGISSAGDVPLYVFYKSATATTPAVDSTYGQYAVFDANVLTSLPMSETSGNVFDKTSNGLGGTDIGGTTSISAVVGKGRSFDGVNDSIQLAMSAASRSQITLEALAKRTASGTKFHFFGQGTAYAARLELYWHTDNKLYAMFTTSGYAYTTAAVAADANWHHVALRYDGAGAGNDGKVDIYVDGVSVGLSFSSTIPTSIPAAAGSPDIGILNQSGSIYTAGSVDEFQFHTVARSADWITTRSSMLLGPGTFFTTGAPADAEGGAGGGSTIYSLINGGLISSGGGKLINGGLVRA